MSTKLLLSTTPAISRTKKWFTRAKVSPKQSGTSLLRQAGLGQSGWHLIRVILLLKLLISEARASNWNCPQDDRILCPKFGVGNSGCLWQSHFVACSWNREMKAIGVLAVDSCGVGSRWSEYGRLTGFVEWA
jgi:hypothetical protein